MNFSKYLKRADAWYLQFYALSSCYFLMPSCYMSRSSKMGFVMLFHLKGRRLDFMLINARTVNSYQQFQMARKCSMFAATVVALLSMPHKEAPLMLQVFFNSWNFYSLQVFPNAMIFHHLSFKRKSVSWGIPTLPKVYFQLELDVFLYMVLVKFDPYEPLLNFHGIEFLSQFDPSFLWINFLLDVGYLISELKHLSNKTTFYCLFFYQKKYIAYFI